MNVERLRSLYKPGALVHLNVTPENDALIKDLAQKIYQAFEKAAVLGIKHVAVFPNGAYMDICASVYSIRIEPIIVDVITNRFHRVLLEKRMTEFGLTAYHTDLDSWLGWFYT